MDVRSLSCFVAAAEELHFHRAAARVFLSQPAFSARIQALEAEVGTALFERDRRRVRLTAAGEALLEPARQAMRQAAHGVAAARRASRGESGHLRLGFTVIAIHGTLPQAVHEYRTTHPDVALELSEMNSPSVERALAADDIDVGVLHPPLTTPALSTQAIAAEPLLLALPAAHPLARRRLLKWRDLAELPFLIAPRRVGPDIYDRLIGCCHAAGFTPRIVQEATPMTTLVGLVAAGVGAGFVAACIASAPRAGVAFRPLSPPAPALPMALAWRTGALSAAGQRFVELAVRMMPPNKRRQSSERPT
jgi:DNA-binding transcriptional LysR family regulator